MRLKNYEHLKCFFKWQICVGVKIINYLEILVSLRKITLAITVISLAITLQLLKNRDFV